jgi:hypothetical protein
MNILTTSQITMYRNSMKKKASNRKQSQHPIAPKQSPRRDVIIAAVFLVLGLVISFLGLPTIQDVWWSNDKLLVKSVGDSHVPLVFGFPIELVNTSRYPITNVIVDLFPEGPGMAGNVTHSRVPIPLIAPRDAAPTTISAEDTFAMGAPPPVGSKYDMVVRLSGTFGFWGWKQKFSRTLYFIGRYEGNGTIRWIEQDASAFQPVQ